MRNRLLKISYFTLCLMAFFTVRINAYIDPSVMTYAIQAIAGVAIALGTVFSLYWRKIVKAIRNVLGVRGNKHTNEESDEIKYINPTTKQELDYTCIGEDEINNTINHELKVGKIEKKQNQEAEISNSQICDKKNFKDIIYNFISGIISGILISLTTTYMLCLYAPLEIYMNNKNEFWFNFEMLIKQCGIICLYFAAVLLLIYIFSYCISKKLYQWILNIGLIILIILYIHGNFYASNMPPMNGTTINWSDYNSSIVISVIISLIVIIVVISLYKILKKEAFNKLINYFCILIICVLTISLGSINDKTRKIKENDNSYSISTLNEFNYSSDENFIIIVLDAVDGQTFKDIINSSSKYGDVFKDFTYYPDTQSAYPYTSMSIPFILTGEWYENKGDFIRFEKNAMQNSKLLSALENDGYRLDVYETEFLYDTNVYRYSNIIKAGQSVDSRSFNKSIINLSLFKYAPYYLKFKFQTSGNDLLSARASLSDFDYFKWDNSQFLSDINNDNITLTSDKVFKFIHLEGGHVPFNYDEECNLINEEQGTYSMKLKGMITMLNAYLNELKKYDAYDNSNIIILSDHGYDADNFDDEYSTVNQRNNSLLMIKGKNENHELIINNSPISFDDLQDMYQNLLSGYDGNNAFEGLLEDNDKRRFLSFVFTHEDVIEEYYQYGYVSDMDTLIPSGNIYKQEDK